MFLKSRLATCYSHLAANKYSKSATVVTLLPFNVFVFDYFWLNR